MSMQEKLTSFAGQAAERMQDPENQARLRSVARASGNVAIKGALGESGLDIMKTDKNGEQKIKKVKAARVAFRAVRNPLGVAQRAGRGVASEARGAVKNGGLEAARSVLGGTSASEIAGNLFSAPSSGESATEDNVWDASPSSTGEQFGDMLGDDSEASQEVSARAGRIARGLGKLRRGSQDAGPSLESQAADFDLFGPDTSPQAPGEQPVQAPGSREVPVPPPTNNVTLW